MSVATSVPPPSFTANGFIAPPESAVLAGVQADQQLAFGGNLNASPATPQGQLAASQTAIIGDCNATFLLYTNLVDPAKSFGRMQDAIGYIYFMERDPSRPTVVAATCAGDGNGAVTIPVGALAQAQDGNVYFCTQAGTIPASGSVVLPFACQTDGPTSCPQGALSTIVSSVPGWDSVTNAAAGVVGNLTETAQEFELRRQLSVAANAQGSLPAVTGAVLGVADVLDCYTSENVTGSPVTVGDVTLAPHSLYVCVAGGLASAVAQAIWTKKGNGCDYNGDTTETVTDTTYVDPQPSYQVKFQTAALTPTLFAVTIKNGVGVPSTALTQIQDAIAAAFTGADGGARARIGGLLLASRYYPGVLALGAWAQVVTIFIGSATATAAAAQFTASASGTTLTVTAVASGTLAPGQTLFDQTGDLAANTQIQSQSSGTAGGTGVYVLTVSQGTIASEEMTAAIADQDDVLMRIDEAPVLSSANVLLTLV